MKTRSRSPRCSRTFANLGGTAGSKIRVSAQRYFFRQAAALCRAGPRVSPLGRLRLPKCSDPQEVKTMAVWSWANVASPVRPSTKAPTHLSICPTDPFVGQVDRSAATITQPNIRETTLSSTAAFTFADRKGEANCLPRTSSRGTLALESWSTEFENSDAVVDQLNGVSGIPANWIVGVASLIAEIRRVRFDQNIGPLLSLPRRAFSIVGRPRPSTLAGPISTSSAPTQVVQRSRG